MIIHGYLELNRFLKDLGEILKLSCPIYFWRELLHTCNTRHPTCCLSQIQLTGTQQEASDSHAATKGTPGRLSLFLQATHTQKQHLLMIMPTQTLPPCLTTSTGLLILLDQVFTKMRPSSRAALGGRNDPKSNDSLGQWYWLCTGFHLHAADQENLFPQLTKGPHKIKRDALTTAYWEHCQKQWFLIKGRVSPNWRNYCVGLGCYGLLVVYIS